MSLRFDTDLGYGVSIKYRQAEDSRPPGYVVEIHFYDKKEAAKFTANLIHEMRKRDKP